ncbi:family 10 glycosylhydrolase [Nostoc sp. FACHB-152]|uniref:glycoside hydrolase family 10 protein n=1 Tax=unclassified Nostoc TaxID=2593658 RepID=UPI0016857B4F|nr:MULTISPECIES: family 10 glycosylhydrolase [unclassified Nostoc]MBD2445847.1 family 10 glycosylhydrolase [Nostoc sp. FACHB-152]MBD2467977.1 family 10 glycosylhydrolase [Nostoc sp. FACHB-145]
MKSQETATVKTKKARFFIISFNLLIINCLSNLNILPVKAATEEPVLSVVQSPENTQQWTGITKRLQSSGFKYCVIPLSEIKSAADWGDRKILFLPNVETLTPAQVIALEGWTSKGGKVIASGPVGSLSAPGVRQFLRSLLGSYWGFGLDGTQQLKPAKTKSQAWANQTELFGKVRGGVLIADGISSQVSAVWNTQDSPAAVVTTESSTLLGWRWGTDAASTLELDNAWLKAAINRHFTTASSARKKIPGAASNCATTIASAGEQGSRGAEGQRSRGSTFQSTVNSQQSTVNNQQPTPQQEAIDQLEQTVRWNVQPDSNVPIDDKEAIALQQELENLISRVESAYLAAAVHPANVGVAVTSNPQSLKEEETRVASTRPGFPTASKEQVIAQARQVAQNIPQLIANKNYALARQQWLATRANLWKNFPINRRLASAEIRAVWLDRGTIVRAGGEKGLAKIFDSLAQSGINTVFFETLNASYPIYPSQVAPQQNPLIRGWNPLAVAVKLAHERGIELHAWVWTFAAGNQRHNQVINVNPNYPGPVLAAHPDWANYDNKGNTIPLGQTKPFFDQANPQLRQYLLKLFEEIVTDYQVDGLQLDYIRYPFQDQDAGRTYGYGKAARAQFQQLTGVDPLTISPAQADLWQKWTDFRTSQVDSFVADVSQMLRKKRENLILSVAVFPLPERERIQKLQQHWEVWARRGDIDLIVPMTYAQDTARFQRLAQPWIASTQLGSTLLVPGIRLLSLPNLGAFDQLQLIRDLPASGYALFAAENLNNDLLKIFNSTQGKVQAVASEPIPHRQPFQTVAVRYAALKREWQFLIQNDQLQIPATKVADFNNQIELLEKAFTQLAAAPSASKLLTAKASLTRFNSQFRIWMRQTAIDNPYQVKVWENRLATIERLLRYGERRSQLR